MWDRGKLTKPSHDRQTEWLENSRFRSGDTIGILCDMDKRTLSFYRFVFASVSRVSHFFFCLLCGYATPFHNTGLSVLSCSSFFRFLSFFVCPLYTRTRHLYTHLPSSFYHHTPHSPSSPPGLQYEFMETQKCVSNARSSSALPRRYQSHYRI